MNEEHRFELGPRFRFIHEPLGTTHRDDASLFVGREQERDELAGRLLLSEGGAFLVTGYRGVGKTTFVHQVMTQARKQLPQLETGEQLVDVHLSVARPMSCVELMYHVLRGIRQRLDELGLLERIPRRLQLDIDMACLRTSASLKMGNALKLESEAAMESSGGWLIPGLSLGVRQSQERSRELQYGAYDDKAAEFDLISIARRLRSRPIKLGWMERTARRLGLRRAPRLKVVIVFDELDKLDHDGKVSPLDEILSNLKNLFTTSGISFVFVAGKRFYERWQEDVGRGDSIFESVFTYARYLPALWRDVDALCESLLDNPSCKAGDAAVLEDFKNALAFRGRGIPRRVLSAINERVSWDGKCATLCFTNRHARQVRFYSGIFELLSESEDVLLGRLRGSSELEKLDRQRLAFHYLVDWVFRNGTAEFTESDAMDCVRGLDRSIAPTAEHATDMVRSVIELLVARNYIAQTGKPPPNDPAPNKSPEPAERRINYRVLPRRLVELGSLTHDTDSDSARTSGAPESLGGDRYRVLKRLARGAFAEVFAARDQTNGSSVAIKRLHAHHAGDPSAISSFIREVSILKRTSPDHVVRLIGAHMEESQPFFTMQLIEGATLDSHIAAHSPMDIEVARSILQQVLFGMRQLHSAGIVWRDATPSNILLDSGGRVTLIDMGVAIDPKSPRAEDGLLAGTPGYIAPEIRSGRTADARSDIWSIGAVAYEMVTNARPYPRAEYLTRAESLEYQVVRPSRIEPSVTPAFEDFIMRCLEVDPARRFQSVDAILDSPVFCRTIAPFSIETPDADHRPQEETTFALHIKGPRSPASESGVSPLTERVADSRKRGKGPIVEYSDVQGAIVSFVLSRPTTSVGRDETCDIAISDPAVSRFHGAFQLVGEGLVFEDHNTASGSFLDGARIPPGSRSRVLRDGDVLALGSLELLFRNPDGTLPMAFHLEFARSRKRVLIHDGLMVLEVAESAGIEIDYACRSGACGTCKVRLLSGEVEMPPDINLSHAERSTGIILACCSTAKSDLVVAERDG